MLMYRCHRVTACRVMMRFPVLSTGCYVRYPECDYCHKESVDFVFPCFGVLTGIGRPTKGYGLESSESKNENSRKEETASFCVFLLPVRNDDDFRVSTLIVVKRKMTKE